MNYENYIFHPPSNCAEAIEELYVEDALTIKQCGGKALRGRNRIVNGV